MLSKQTFIKNKFLVLGLILLKLTGYRQISVNAKNVKKAGFHHFDEVKTIFVLPQIYSKATYDSILESSWHLTPYEIVNNKDFHYSNFIGDEHIFVQISAYKTGKDKKGKKANKLRSHSFIEFYTYNYHRLDNMLKDFYKRRIKTTTRAEIFAENKIVITQILLYPTSEFDSFMSKYDYKAIKKYLSGHMAFYNFQPGFLKNYFQKVEDLIKKEQKYWIRKKEYLPEIKNLSRQTLYIPEYVARVYNPSNGTFSQPDKAFIDNIFKNYRYNYQLIDIDDLNKIIMNNEQVYYLQFIRLNRDRFLAIVNAQTGEIIYRSFEPVISDYNLDASFINELNTIIDTQDN